mmetsp:Transcript_23806/g.68110  ORF Transcript_23806/g.68110 Transcript_23806/m.68110 type:complete len:308 (-) Transcript_23806:95-1018(-)
MRVLDGQLHHVVEPAVVQEVRPIPADAPQDDEVVAARGRALAPPPAVAAVVHEVPEQLVLEPRAVRDLPDAADVARLPLREVRHVERLAARRPAQRGRLGLHAVVEDPLQGELVLLVQAPEVVLRQLQRPRLGLALPEGRVPELQVELRGQLVHADAAGRGPHGPLGVGLRHLARRPTVGVVRRSIVGRAPTSFVEELLEILEAAVAIESRVPLRVPLDAVQHSPLHHLVAPLLRHRNVALRERGRQRHGLARHAALMPTLPAEPFLELVEVGAGTQPFVLSRVVLRPKHCIVTVATLERTFASTWQ